MKTKQYEIVDNVEKLESTLQRVRVAQREFASYSQTQVDAIFLAAASAANKARISLAKLAVEETGMGLVEDKVIKNNYAAEYIYNAYKDTKTCGVIEEDKAFGIKKIAEPIGVIAAVIPTTNPTSTAIFKCLLALKTRNAIIISPHPRAKNSTIAAAKLILEAAVSAGAPEGIIDWIDVPSLELTNTIMKEADIILATGGPGMVKAAYSSGKPALGVGAGNTPAIIDESADTILAVNSIIHSKTFDNGMICASEQSVIVLEPVYDAVKEEFAKRGCYFLNPEETEKVRKTIIINGALNAKIVGQPAAKIASLAGVTVPEGTKILIGEVESVERGRCGEGDRAGCGRKEKAHQPFYEESSQRIKNRSDRSRTCRSCFLDDEELRSCRQSLPAGGIYGRLSPVRVYPDKEMGGKRSGQDLLAIDLLLGGGKADRWQ